jgi:hypothetical protein
VATYCTCGYASSYCTCGHASWQCSEIYRPTHQRQAAAPFAACVRRLPCCELAIGFSNMSGNVTGIT